MPKIAAPTVAEHRRIRRAALIEAALELLLDQGYDALTFAAVAERAGIARNSVYEYFSSREDLLVAVCEEAMPAWVEAIEKAMSGATTPEGVVRTFVTTQLDRVASGHHRLAQAVSGSELSAAGRARVHALHAGLTRPLEQALRQLGHRRPAVMAALLQGIVRAATELIEHGLPVSQVTQDAVRLALEGVRGG